MLGGCGGSQPPIGAPGAMPQRAQITGHADRGTSRMAPEAKGIMKGDLLVDGLASSNVLIFKNNSWSEIGTITNGLEGPEGSWVDSHRNFYAANAGDGDITEYDKSGSLIDTYSGMQYPMAVTTDRKGNVYAADWLGRVVDEYRQGKNVVVATCSIAGEPRGVAVDKEGDVFVDYSNASGGGGGITELSPGLTSCSGAVLGASLNTPSGMVLDRNKNIVVCDSGNGTVAVIDPPYSDITGYLGKGYSLPTGVTINRTNTQAYVTDYLNDQVSVLNYPSGSTIAILDYANGLETPWNAVDGSNYVP
jgi:DNA-binding beta-propeller fold protein YncE